jgi:carbon starvation protein
LTFRINDYVDATLAGLFVMVVLTMAVYGVIGIRKALGTSSVTAIEVRHRPAGQTCLTSAPSANGWSRPPA